MRILFLFAVIRSLSERGDFSIPARGLARSVGFMRPGPVVCSPVLHSPALRCPVLHSPTLRCAVLLCSPTLRSAGVGLQRSGLFEAACRIPSGLGLPCTVLHSPVLPCAVLCSPTLRSAVLYSPTLRSAGVGLLRCDLFEVLRSVNSLQYFKERFACLCHSIGFIIDSMKLISSSVKPYFS